MSNIFFVGAHPDDIEIGCGGALIEHVKNGDNVFAIIVTNGEIGNVCDQTQHYDRLDETTKALTYNGQYNVKLIFFYLSDTSLWKERQQLLNLLENTFNKYDIDKVYTHTEKSYHQDHVTVHEETIRALRNNKKIDILAYETNGSTKSSFSPNYFVDISNVLEIKQGMIKFHISQSEKFSNNHDLINTLAKFRAHQAKMNGLAEGFEVIRIYWKSGMRN